MIRKWRLFALLAALVIAVIVMMRQFTPDEQASDRVVINEAARTLLYLPLYHAKRMGYFNKQGIDVEIVTGGSAATAVAAVITGDADVAVADPMYAPISQSNGSDLVVIGQLVGRIGLWALARPGTAVSFDPKGLRNARIITHPKPMSSYTYAELLLQQYGISEIEANFVEAKPGTEVATYRAQKSAPFIVAVEPVVSVLQDDGAKVVYSWPEKLGDRVFSGLLVRRATLQDRAPLYARLLRAFQQSLDDIANRDPDVQVTAKEYFASLEEDELTSSIKRLTDEQVFAKSLRISRASWDSAVGARRQVGDLTTTAAFSENVAAAFTAAALRGDH